MFANLFYLLAATQFLLLLADASALVEVSSRPSFEYSPKQPWRPMPVSSDRTKVCTVPARGDWQDDSENILAALEQCNHGGHVVFEKEAVYTIGTALDLSFLDQIDIDIQGTIRFTNDTDYWQANSFKFAYQDSSSFFVLGGTDVNIYGGGTLDGQGQAWWDLLPTNSSILRPVLFVIEGLDGGSMSDITLVNSPNWFNIIKDSKNFVYDNISISAKSSSVNPFKNTDGWDTLQSSNIVIQNSVINNGDDCVSFKPNSTDILVQNLQCNGSHGISVGSLGQYAGEIDIVENVSVYNIDMANASDGARIKVWPGAAPDSEYGTGGGGGYVRNIVYDGMHVSNVDWAIQLTGCYGVSDASICQEYPAQLLIENVLFINFEGVTSRRYSPDVATLVCSTPDVCSNITVADFRVVSPSGTDEAICTNASAPVLSSVQEGANYLTAGQIDLAAKLHMTFAG